MEFPDTVRKDLIRLLPSSIVQEVTCYCYYDDHPRDARKLDLVACNNRGEVFEFYKREIVSSILLDNVKIIKDIFLLRNENCELFYVLDAETEIIILSAKEDLNIHLIIKNIASFKLVDKDFSGLPSLKVIRKDDAVPLFYDSNFKLIEPIVSGKPQSDTSPVMVQLLRKLTEAKFNVKQNEETLEEYAKLKQSAAFSLYEKDNPNTEESLFKIGPTVISKTLNVTTRTPFVKLCNKKVIIIVNISNGNNVPIDNIHILFHGVPNSSITYTTKIYDKLPTPPFWREKEFHAIQSSEYSFIVGILDVKELKYTISSKIEFEAVLSYTKLGRSYMLPLENVSISAIETMGENFDVLLSKQDDENTILAILATSEKTELILMHIDHVSMSSIDILEVVSKHLHMEILNNMKNVLIYRKATCHILFGLTLIFLDSHDHNGSVKVQVYSRSTAQVIAFIHYMYDSIPYRLMATLEEHDIVAKNKEYSDCESKTKKILDINYKDYATSLVNQSKLILKYFDDCIIKMNESSSPDIQSKIGCQIHLLSTGLSEFLTLRNRVLQESVKGIQTLRTTEIVNTDSEEILMDE